jgi:hypothetical protein
MAYSITLRYTANAHQIKLVGQGDSGFVTNNRVDHDNPIVAAIAQNFASTGATSGVVTISVT